MNRNKRYRNWFLLFLFWLVSANLHAQSFAQKEITTKRIFDKLVNAYGNAKAPPKLILIPNTQKEMVVALYSNTPSPVIKVDEKLFDICKTLQADSLNALATIISHELAHYYNDHSFCSDYAFATKNKLLLKASKESKIEKETKADRDGLFYAMIAGYQPLQSFEKVLNKIYKSYELPVTLPGYPSLDERIKMIDYQAEEVTDLQAVYNAGLLLLYLNELSKAASCFTYLSMYFPSREVYNNLGVATFLQAVQNNPGNNLNLIYPIDIDPVSRLYGSNSRGSANKDPKELLKEAKRYFERAQMLDPKYFPSFINLACVNTALANYDMALGVLYEAEDLQNKNEVQILHLKAIINAKQNNQAAALALFEKIEKKDSLAAYNYHLLKTALESNKSLLKIDDYKAGWIKNLQNESKSDPACDTEFNNLVFSNIIKVNDGLVVRRNKKGSINVQLDGKSINAVISFEESDSPQRVKIINKTRGCMYLLNKMLVYEVESN